MVVSLQIDEASATVENGLMFTVSGALASSEADMKGVNIVASFTRFVPSDGGAYTCIRQYLHPATPASCDICIL